MAILYFFCVIVPRFDTKKSQVILIFPNFDFILNQENQRHGSIFAWNYFCDKAVTCVYKLVVEVTRRTGEDVIQVMEEYNIITDDQLSTVEEVTQVVDSDYNLTEEEQKVYELILKKQEIMAIAAKNKEVQKEK